MLPIIPNIAGIHSKIGRINNMLSTKLIHETILTDLFNFNKIAETISNTEITMVEIVIGFNWNDVGGVNNDPIKLNRIPSIPAIIIKLNPVFGFGII